MNSWHTLDTAAVIHKLDTDLEQGLESEEAGRRLLTQGPNELIEQGGRNLLRIVFEQFTSVMVLLLVAAALVSGLILGDWPDALVILVIVLLNAVVGFWQEYRAEKALAALKKLAVPRVKVRRGGEVGEISARELVCGDLVLLETGNLVPADCRLIECVNLRVQEAALTGEAEAIEKSSDVIEQIDPPLGDRLNMSYMGTVVTYGRGRGVVTATGMQTELGKIATLLQQTTPEKTVLQLKLRQLSMVLVFAAVALIGLVALEGFLLQGQSVKEIFLTAVSMAVAAIPEGLPAVVTIALALGAQRMLRRHALIRKLPAVESLGSVTVICTDKTGTLTQNRMTATVLQMSDHGLELPGTPETADSFSQTLSRDSVAQLILAGGALCNDAELTGGEGSIETVGDPTEGALVSAAARFGWRKPTLEACFPRIDERPFDSMRKRMSTIHQLNDSGGTITDLSETLQRAVRLLGPEQAAAVCFTKGAVDALLPQCTSLWQAEAPIPLTKERREEILRINADLAGDGIRVLGVALKPISNAKQHDPDPESDLSFLGMIGLRDPLRPEVKEAVDICRRAGIRPVMITGDHPVIARYIARELRISADDRVLTGQDLQRMDPRELSDQVESVSVFARVAPEHKLKIVDALQARGHLVAMTGDGVNDAPALKSADIGVAMGITGTDVSKEASSMVLQDDNFATILAAVEEGRIIFDNILRFVRYILSSNWAEILAMLLAPLLGLPIPLYPVQILWMNLVTDGLPALALGVEPGEGDVMDRPPRNPRQPILTRASGIHILWVGTLMAILALGIGISGYRLSADTGAWRTMLFTTLVFCQLTLALVERSRSASLVQIGLFSNPSMAVAVPLTFGLQMAAIYVPFLQVFFRTVPLTLAQLGACLALSLVMILAVETEKLISRNIRRRRL